MLFLLGLKSFFFEEFLGFFKSFRLGFICGYFIFLSLWIDRSILNSGFLKESLSVLSYILANVFNELSIICSEYFRKLKIKILRKIRLSIVEVILLKNPLIGNDGLCQTSN